jgi:hypothetical protein
MFKRKLSRLQFKTKQAQSLFQESQLTTPNSTEWTSIQIKLSRILNDVRVIEPSKPIRISLFESGIYNVAISIIAAKPGLFRLETIEDAWYLASESMYVSDANSKSEDETVYLAVQLGLIELAAKELQYKPNLRYHGRIMEAAFICLTCAASMPDLAHRVIANQVVENILDIIERGDISTRTHIENLSSSLIVLTWLAMTKREALLHHLSSNLGNIDVIQLISPLFVHLENVHDDKIVLIGFQAVRVIIRLYITEDIGANQVQRHAISVIQFYCKVMQQVLTSGKAKGFVAFHGHWALNGLCLDASLLSLSNKCNRNGLLSPLIPYIIEMMSTYGYNDYNVLYHGLIFLTEISQDKDCLQILLDYKLSLKQIEHVILSEWWINPEIRVLLGIVLEFVS